MTIKEEWRTRTDCRLCGAARLGTVLELAPTPPANEFVREDDQPQELIPLYLARCADCGHVQLPVVVDPERLFRNYVYVSGTSPAFVRHFREYAEEAVTLLGLKPNDLVVDIGSNDGTLLREFKRLGMRVLGVDPARAIAEEATQAGIPTWPEFFTRDTAARIRWEHGEAALVVANNVFAHADDLRTIAFGVRDLLSPSRGCFAFEVQYLVDLVQKTLFDMVYHEHLSYHSLGPLVRFLDSVGMAMVDAQRVPTHGGSVRCFVAPRRAQKPTARLASLLGDEAAALALSVDPWGDLRRRIDDAGEKLRGLLMVERQAGRQVAGYGAPAKLTTLCHQFGVTRADISYVVDDSPWKQGLLAPGTRIPVVAPFSAKHAPDAFVVFAWNFADSIAARLRTSGYRGKIVAPLPEYKELP